MNEQASKRPPTSPPPEMQQEKRAKLQSDSAYGRRYSEGGHEFFSINTSRDVALPERWPDVMPGNIFNKDNMHLSMYLAPRWYLPEYEYLAYVPLYPSFDDYFCRALDVEFQTREDLERDRQGYYHMPRRVLSQWLSVLCEMNKIITCLVGVKKTGQRLLRTPLECGFNCAYRDWRTALCRIRQSRDWFGMHFGYLTWILSEHGLLSENPTLEARRALGDSAVDQTFLNAVLHANVIRISQHVPRVGCFFDPACYQMGETVTILTKLHSMEIPVWISLDGRNARLVSDPQLLRWNPDTWHYWWRARSTQAEPANVDWRIWMHERALRNAARILEEDEETRRERVGRARVADADLWTGKSEVYKWDWVNGKRVRTRLSGDRLHAEMSRYPIAQRRYDAFEDEWDICSEFDKEEREAEEDSTMFEEAIGHWEIEFTPKTVDATESDDNKCWSERITRIKELYGLSVTTRFGGESVRLERTLAREFCWSTDKLPTIDNLLRDELKDAYQSFLKGRQGICDLLPLDSTIDDRLKRCVKKCKDGYVVTPDDNNLKIFVRDAEATVLCCRHDMLYSTIVLALYRNGVKFNVCIETDFDPGRSAFGDFGIGMRTVEGNDLDQVYASYRKDLSIWLSGSKRRAALLCGGLISWIARELIADDEECERLALERPSPTALFSKSNHVTSLADNTHLFDDCLSPLEKNFMLGEFYIRQQGADNLSHLSFHPPLSVLEKRTGQWGSWYWTEYNVYGFQKTRAEAHKTDKWRNRVNREKAADRVFRVRYNALCKDVIEM